MVMGCQKCAHLRSFNNIQESGNSRILWWCIFNNHHHNNRRIHHNNRRIHHNNRRMHHNNQHTTCHKPHNSWCIHLNTICNKQKSRKNRISIGAKPKIKIRIKIKHTANRANRMLNHNTPNRIQILYHHYSSVLLQQAYLEHRPVLVVLLLDRYRRVLERIFILKWKVLDNLIKIITNNIFYFIVLYYRYWLVDPCSKIYEID